MATDDVNAEIQERIESFVNELSDLVRQAALESVQEALGTEEAAPAPRRGPGRPSKKAGRRGPGRPPGSTSKRRGGGKRSSEELERLTQAVQHHIANHPGERIEEISAGMGLPTKELNLPVKKLLADKSIKKKGQKRATTYYPR